VTGASVGAGVSVAAGPQAVRSRLTSMTALSKWNNFVFIESLLRENEYETIRGNLCGYLCVLPPSAMIKRNISIVNTIVAVS
jgi:hypothetical protein